MTPPRLPDAAWVEPLYAAPGSPTVLFVLSRELELRMAKDGSPTGRLRAGSFDVPFKRVMGPGEAHWAKKRICLKSRRRY